MGTNSYSNSRHKLKSLWDLAHENKNDISSQIIINTSNENKLEKANYVTQIIRGSITVETEWQYMEIISVEIGTYTFTTLNNNYVTTLINVPEKLIPFIKSEIIHQVSIDHNPALLSSTDLKKVCVVHVIDIPSSTNLKIVKLHNYISYVNPSIGTPTSESQIVSQYQTKLLITLLNPKEYQ